MISCDGFNGGPGWGGPWLGGTFTPFAGRSGRFFRRGRFGFRRRLRTLLNFPLAVLTTGGVAPIFGILTSVNPGFITLAGGPGRVAYIPVNEISAISRVF